MARTKPTPRTQMPTPTALSPLPENTQPILRTGQEAVAYHIPTTPSASKTTISLPRYSRWTSGLHYHATHTEYLRLVRGSIFAEVNGETKFLSAAAGGEVNPYSGDYRNPSTSHEGKEVILTIPKFTRHNWGRADALLRTRRAIIAPRALNFPSDIDDEVVVEEWTEPRDIAKPLFFWNLNGVITGTSPDGGPVPELSSRQKMAKTLLGNWWVPFQLFVIMWDLDNWPVFWSLGGKRTDALWEKICLYFLELVEHVMTFVVLFGASILGLVFGIRAVERSRTPEDLWKKHVQS